MYKDKDKQRDANRERQKRRRDKIKAKGVTDSGCDKQGVTEPKQGYIGAVPETPETIAVMPKTERGNIRVSKPGDADYVPQCETTRAFIEGRPKRPETGKRGNPYLTMHNVTHETPESVREPL